MKVKDAMRHNRRIAAIRQRLRSGRVYNPTARHNLRFKLRVLSLKRSTDRLARAMLLCGAAAEQTARACRLFVRATRNVNSIHFKREEE